MNCHVCQTNLPDGAICCYKCGVSVGGAIRQVEPLPVFESERTTFVRPRGFDSTSGETTRERERSSADFIKIALSVVLLVGGIVGGIAFISSRESPLTAQSPQNQTKSTVLQTTPTPKAKKTPSSTPLVSPPMANSTNRLPANTDPQENQPPGNYAVNSIPPRSQTNSPDLPPEQIQRGFEVALQFLKNEMLSAAVQKAKNKHPLSRLENCTQEVTWTSQSGSLQEYSGKYQCRLRGTVLGRDVFETTVNVTGKIEHRYGSFFRSVSGSEIGADIKINNYSNTY
jgi:hypothetical protein